MKPFEIPTVPKLIHYTGPAKNKWHPVWVKCQKSWVKHFPEPEYTHVYWSDDDLTNLVKDYYPEFFELYESLPFHIMRIDLAEYLIMHRYGGIYHDLDMYCYQNFYDDVKFAPFALLESPMKDEFIQNCMFLSSPKALFWTSLVQRIKETFYPYPDTNELDVPKILDPCFYIQDLVGCFMISRFTLQTSQYKNIHLLPKEEYNPPCNTYNKAYKTKHMLTNTWGNDYIEANIKNMKKGDQGDFKNIQEWFKFHYKKRPDLDKDAL